MFYFAIFVVFLYLVNAVCTVETAKSIDTNVSYENSKHINSNTLCGHSNWVAYKDEKCFKLIKKWASYNEAENICTDETLEADSYLPTLVSIKSADEQNYLANYIFNISGVNVNVWIGAERRPENINQFVWNDGSNIKFINWAEGSPSEEIRKGCVQIQSGLAKQFYNTSNLYNNEHYGKWKDVICETANYVICQKLQTWSFPKLQKKFLDTRKELSDLQQNPVPISFIYVQLPGQPKPINLWPIVKWKEVTSDYAGLFFRAEGGDSEQFGVEQKGDSSRLTMVSFNVQPRPSYGTISISPGLWSENIAAGNMYHVDGGDGLQFYVSNVKTRPRNKAVRIWTRIK